LCENVPEESCTLMEKEEEEAKIALKCVKESFWWLNYLVY
jgi:hypothetical protein